MKQFIFIILFILSLASLSDAQTPLYISKELNQSIPSEFRPKNPALLTLSEAIQVVEVGVNIFLDRGYYNFVEIDSLAGCLEAALAVIKGTDLKIKGYDALCYYYNLTYYSDERAEQLSFKNNNTIRMADSVLNYIGHQSKYEKLQYTTLLTKADAYSRLYDNYEEAAEILNNCEQYFAAENDSSNLSEVSRIQIAIHTRLQLYDEAADYIDRRLLYLPKDQQYYKTDKPALLIMSSMLNLKSFELNSDSVILKSVNHKLQQLRRLDLIPEIWNRDIMILTAIYEYSLGEMELARQLADSASLYEQKSKRIISEGDAATYKALIYLKSGTKEDLFALLKAHLKKKFQLTPQLFQFLYKHELEQGNWKEALKYYQDMKKAEEKQNIIGNRSLIFKVNQKYKVKEKEAAISQLTERNNFNELRFNLSVIIGVLLILLGAIGFLSYNRDRKLSEMRQQEAHQKKIIEMQEILKEQERIIEEKLTTERRHIGRHLHDGLSSNLAVIKYMMQSFRFYLKDEKVKEKYVEIEYELNNIYRQSRDYSHKLSADNTGTNIANNVDIAAYLEGLEERFIGLGIINIVIDANKASWNELDPIQTKYTYWILKECFANTVKHSKAENILIKFQLLDKIYSLEFIDDGIGLNEAVNNIKGIGLSNMKNAVRYLNGTMLLLPSVKGLHLKFCFPKKFS